ncbi:MAG TPA: hypothetical protein VEC36_12630, partial [Patescibacteria group bacterium]|nr:hypothetical protein [Patescibacteria group bacterium]
MKISRLLLWLILMLSPILFLNSCEETGAPTPTVNGPISGVLLDEEGWGVPEALIAATDAQ